MEHQNCTSCNKNIANDIAAVKFPCPGCRKEDIYRCKNCRKTSIKYVCSKCKHEGP